MGVIEEVGRGPVGLDTVVFIYFIEEHPQYLPLIEPLFAAIDAGTVEGVTSSLIFLETLVVPYRVGNVPLGERYEALLTNDRELPPVPGLKILQLQDYLPTA